MWIDTKNSFKRFPYNLVGGLSERRVVSGGLVHLLDFINDLCHIPIVPVSINLSEMELAHSYDFQI